MIIATEKDTKKVSTFGGKRIKYQVDPEAMGPIMRILSRQYSDTSLAPIREYTTNAIDAQVEAGWYRPVEITTPTFTNPIFKVQDFGIGMNAESIEQTYAFYGASTKRNSNDFNGSMGIGSKSAFAYTNQFTVVGIKDGIKTNVVVSRDAEGGGDLEIVSETPTTEPNGTTVSFTVRNHSEFTQKIFGFAKALAPGLLLVDGKDLSEWGTYKKIIGQVKDSDGNVVINGIYHTERASFAYAIQDKIYMGGIAYPALKALSSVRPASKYNILADVPLGKVVFTPSREALEDTPSTQAVHKLIEKVYVENLVKAVLSDIKGSKTLIEAYRTFLENANILTDADVSYEGTPLKGLGRSFDITHYEYTRSAGVTGYSGGRGTAYQDWTLRVREITDTNLIFVTGYPVSDGKGVPASYEKKAVYWLEHSLVLPEHWDSDLSIKFLFVESLPADAKRHPLLKKVPVVKFDDIKAIKLPRTYSGGGGKRVSLGGKFHVFDAANGSVAQEQHIHEFSDKDVYYVMAAEYKRGLIDSGRSRTYGDVNDTFGYEMREHRKFLGDKAVIVSLYASRKEKFLRDLGKPATDIGSPKDVLNAWMDAAVAKVTPDIVKKAALYQHSDTGAVRVLKNMSKSYGIKFDDPLVNKVIAYDGQFFGTYTPFRNSVKHRQQVEAMIAKAGKEIENEVEAVSTCYPLLDVVEWRGMEKRHALALADYINETYNTNTNGGKNAL